VGFWGVVLFFLFFGKSVWNFTKKLITSDQLLKKEGLLVWLKHVKNEGYNHNKY